jgi:hypothetical protein
MPEGHSTRDSARLPKKHLNKEAGTSAREYLNFMQRHWCAVFGFTGTMLNNSRMASAGVNCAESGIIEHVP